MPTDQPGTTLTSSQFYPFHISDSLCLDSLKSADATKFFSLVQNNRDHLERFDPFVAQYQSVKDVRESLGRIQTLYLKGKSLSCGIWDKNELVGYLICGLDWDDKSAKIGYGLADGHQGHGIISRAARVVLHHAFYQLGIERAWLTCWINNDRSIRVAERLGFKREAKTLPVDPARNIAYESYRYNLYRD
ncbi:MAG: GCN5-related N-acetyltransferase [Patescibacteria group bacterium]|nr:GCN5-related N-acetyltransferase [Patescibacteria group bacterium]